MRANKGLFKGLNPTMAMTALTVITLFLLFGMFVPETAATWFVGPRTRSSPGSSGTTSWWSPCSCSSPSI